MKYLISGDSAVIIEFGNEISSEINNKIRVFNELIKESNIPGITETVPTFRSLLIYYDPLKIYFNELKEKLDKISVNVDLKQESKKKIIEIPVCYGGVFGQDLEFVAENSKMSVNEVIKIHTSKEYLIYMLGFLPGFAYLGGLDERLYTPRLKNPRTRIEQGSVGIGGEQTGIYPVASPGGWRLIGTTPVKTYDANRENPILYKAGDYIKFFEISPSDFYEIKNLADKNLYHCNVIERSLNIGDNY